MRPRLIPRLFCTAAVAATAMVSAPRAVAQTYPGKPIHFIVGQTVGGASDLFARMMGQKLYEAWKRPVVLDACPGAAGCIGAERTGGSAPDGCTLLLATAGQLVINQSLY